MNSSQNATNSRGGKRAGAGRKPSTLKGIMRRLPAETAELILAEIKAQEKWIKLARSRDERIVLDTLKYLTDRAYGKAPQSVEVTGGMTHKHEFDPSRLTDEQLAQARALIESAHVGSDR